MCVDCCVYLFAFLPRRGAHNSTKWEHKCVYIRPEEEGRSHKKVFRVYFYPTRKGQGSNSNILVLRLSPGMLTRVELNSWSIERGGLRGLTNDH